MLELYQLHIFSLLFDDQIKQIYLKNEMAYGGMSMSAMLKYGGAS